MSRVVVADAGPLIGLARIDRLKLLKRLYREVCVPAAVHAELAIQSDRPGAKMLAHAFESGWLSVHPVPDTQAVAELIRLLDLGEAEAIVLAGKEDARFLIIDDARGRRVARGRGVPVVGLAGVLLAAKSRGLLSAVAPVLDELARAGYRLSPQLIASVLARAAEESGSTEL